VVEGVTILRRNLRLTVQSGVDFEKARRRSDGVIICGGDLGLLSMMSMMQTPFAAKPGLSDELEAISKRE